MNYEYVIAKQRTALFAVSPLSICFRNALLYVASREAQAGFAVRGCECPRFLRELVDDPSADTGLSPEAPPHSQSVRYQCFAWS